MHRRELRLAHNKPDLVLKHESVTNLDRFVDLHDLLALVAEDSSYTTVIWHSNLLRPG